MGSAQSGVQASSANYQGPQSFDPLSGSMGSTNYQLTGVTPFVRGFSNIGHTYSGPYSETIINYTYPTNHVRPHAVSSRSNGDSFTYDANGNMTQRVQNSVTWTQTFDAENHLTSVSDGTTTTQYVYDGNGNRVKRIVGTTTTVYVAGMEIELHSGTEDHRTVYYTAGGAFRVIGGTNAGLYYRHTDHLGSTSVLSDSSGNKVANSDVIYAPFGETRVGSLSTLTDFGFTGQHIDRTDGLMYYHARYYLPGLDRFISADSHVASILEPQSLNRFAYVGNDPIKYTDPTGHVACWTGDGAKQCAADRVLNNAYGQIGVLNTQLRQSDVVVDFMDSSITLSQQIKILRDTTKVVKKMGERAAEFLKKLDQTDVSGTQAYKDVFGPTQFLVYKDPFPYGSGACCYYGQNFGTGPVVLSWDENGNPKEKIPGIPGYNHIKMSVPGYYDTGRQGGPTWIAHEIAHNVTNRGTGYNDYTPGDSYKGPNIWDVIYPNSGQHPSDCVTCERTADVIAAWAYDWYVEPGSISSTGSPITQADINAARSDIDSWMLSKIAAMLGVSVSP